MAFSTVLSHQYPSPVHTYYTSGMRPAKPSYLHSAVKPQTTGQKHGGISMKTQNDDAFEGTPGNGTKSSSPVPPAGSSANNKNSSGGDGDGESPNKNQFPNTGPSAMVGGNNGSGQKDKDTTNDSGSGSDDDNDNDSDSDKDSKTNQLPSTPNNPCQTINDNDGRVQYTGVWTLESKTLPHGHTVTSHTTTNAGSQASILFNGTSVTVIGTVNEGNTTVPPAVATYTVDDENPVELPLPFSDRSLPGQMFFESASLPLASHRLVINITSSGSPYTLNSLSICSKITNPITAVSAPPSPEKRKLNPVIIGGIVGGSVTMFLLLFLACILLRRRRRKFRAARTAASPITKWLEQRLSGTLFTSSESIMRNTPPNPSSGVSDLIDKLSAVEKDGESKGLAPLPHQATSPMTTDSHASPQSLASSWILPSLTVSDRQPGSADPEAHLNMPPHPPLPARGTAF